jgi:TolA-binding protein
MMNAPVIRFLLWSARGLALGAAIILIGCAPQANEQQNGENLQLRGMIASDQQQIAGLKEQLSQLQDQIDELRHGGVGGGGGRVSRRQYAAINGRLTKLETAVSTLQSGAVVSSSTSGAPTPGITPPGAVPSGGPGMEPGTPAAGEGAAAPAPGEAPQVPGAESAPPNSAASDTGTGSEEAPPPAAMSEVGPDWHAALDQEQANAKSSSDPAASLYEKGLQDMKAGNFADAVSHFGTLMRRFPKSDLTEPAEYFSANALYEQGKYEQSILQFNDLVIRSPKGRYASAALLREAQAFLKINDRIDAKLTLQKLLADHSGSAQASAANSMLKDLQAD